MTVRDRIKEFRRVLARDLVPNARNWRTHPTAQADALRGILAEIGYAGALLARETEDGRLVLIDGHLRAETTPDMEVPVLVLDVTEAEADKLLATYDPLSAMAGADSGKLEELLASVSTDNDALGAMLSSLAAAPAEYGSRAPTDPANDPAAEWGGMPEFKHEDKTSSFRCIVHFASEEDLAAFEERIGQTVPRNRWAVWYPEAEVERFSDKEYAVEGPRGERP